MFPCFSLPQNAQQEYEISECQSLVSKPRHSILKNKNQFLTGDVLFYDIKGFLSRKKTDDDKEQFF